MKIIYSTQNSNTFSDINCGDLFKFLNDSNVYMKIPCVDVKILGTVNSINLTSGKHSFMDSNLPVIKLDAELIIK